MGLRVNEATGSEKLIHLGVSKDLKEGKLKNGVVLLSQIVGKDSVPDKRKGLTVL